MCEDPIGDYILANLVGPSLVHELSRQPCTARLNAVAWG